MICNICGQEMITHKFEELDVCDQCQILIDKELAKAAKAAKAAKQE